MNLRVFSGGGQFAYAEISSRSIPYHNRLFVPLIPADSSSLKEIQEMDENLAGLVYFQEKRWMAYFLSVRSLNVENHNLRTVDILEEEDSRNILNHLLDSLAYRD